MVLQSIEQLKSKFRVLWMNFNGISLSFALPLFLFFCLFYFPVFVSPRYKWAFDVSVALVNLASISNKIRFVHVSMALWMTSTIKQTRREHKNNSKSFRFFFHVFFLLFAVAKLLWQLLLVVHRFLTVIDEYNWKTWSYTHFYCFASSSLLFISFMLNTRHTVRNHNSSYL